MATLISFNRDLPSSNPMAYGGSSVFTTKRLEDMTPQEYQDYFNKVQTSFTRNKELDSLNPRAGATLGGSSNSLSSSSSSNLFGTGGLGDFTTLTDQAKDLARFRLGLDKEQSEFSFGLRDKEAEGNFGRQFKLDSNQRTFDQNINRDTQEAMTGRLDKELTNRLQQQERGINQENFATSRAIRLASRRLGSR